MNTPKDAAFITLAGFFGLWLCALPLWRNYKARDWPKVPGTVISSQVEVQYSTADTRGMNRLVRVEYRYSVGGKEYRSQRASERRSSRSSCVTPSTTRPRRSGSASPKAA
jgi:hypothetical protein